METSSLFTNEKKNDAVRTSKSEGNPNDEIRKQRADRGAALRHSSFVIYSSFARHAEARRRRVIRASSFIPCLYWLIKIPDSLFRESPAAPVHFTPGSALSTARTLSPV